jgi:hypothetical protein
MFVVPVVVLSVVLSLLIPVPSPTPVSILAAPSPAPAAVDNVFPSHHQQPVRDAIARPAPNWIYWLENELSDPEGFVGTAVGKVDNMFGVSNWTIARKFEVWIESVSKRLASVLVDKTPPTNATQLEYSMSVELEYQHELADSHTVLSKPKVTRNRTPLCVLVGILSLFLMLSLGLLFFSLQKPAGGPRVRRQRLEDNCSICWDGSGEWSAVSTLPCGHSFHAECLSNWMSINPSCPYCRARQERVVDKYAEFRLPEVIISFALLSITLAFYIFQMSRTLYLD